MIRVVFDSNVLVSALLRKHSAPRRAVDLVLTDARFQLALSDFILAETQRVLLSTKLDRYFASLLDREAVVKEFIARLDEQRLPVPVVSTIDEVKDDPPDNQILACALDGSAHYVVTGNERHLNRLGVWRGIKIVKASEFLAEFATL